MPANSNVQGGIQSVSRAVAILKCFTGHSELGLTEISRMVGLHKSTTSGIVSTLKNEGFLEQSEAGGKFRLGIDLFSLAINARTSLSELCEPYLARLLEITGETVNLAVPSNTEIVYVAKKESAHSIKISTNVGKRLPVYCTANGKVILATYNRDKALSMLDCIDFIPFTENTLRNKDALLRELDIVTAEGVAYDNEEFEEGVVCVAAPLYNKPGEPVGSVSVSGPLARMDNNTRQTIAKTLLEITGKICAELSRIE